MRGLIIATGALLLAAPTFARDAAPPRAAVDPTRLSETVKTLASDEYEGRAPGTAGERKTIEFLIARFKAMGLEPGGDKGGWTQAVPLIHTRIGTGGSISLGVANGQPMALAQSTEINLTTVRDTPRIDIAAAPMVFVGYGVNAPEAGWDDFKGVDLKGKVAIFLVNDPDFEAVAGEDAVGRFGGRRMTYYGRWTYKFEEAARRGAIAALIVHDTGGAGYGWSTAAASNGENFDIVRAANDPRVPLQGWIEHDTATRIFAAAKLDLSALRVQARSAGFRPVELKGLNFNAALPVSVERIESANVLAILPGKTRPDESVMFAAHWDAYGAGPADAQGKTIRPGANDDGLGVAGVLELARLFKAAARADRSMVFALWTGEERGLLGSEYYATHPLKPLSKTAANLTLDILQTAGPARDVILVGAGNSSLDADLTAAAKAQGRVITPETFSERGLFYRADHFSVVRRGVPSLLLMALGGASDLKAGGRVAGQKWLDDYMTCYHKTCDAWSADWNLDGAATDITLFYTMGKSIANARSWPMWSEGSEFAATRAKTKADRP
ncbi:M28 family metallopeptidase [Sphingomonas sp. ERG5]|uniref:M28 family metallopeptidase n=1 Tax=Sphingomonas sp. ERG5 TaxID=1381597 RepID=UPI00054B0EF8|nr:M28 family metallopeptidase [Sphingomonas sp. ERG5]